MYSISFKSVMVVVTGFLVLFLLAAFPSTAFAQPFVVVSSYPADGSVNIPTLVTFELSFSEPLDVSAVFPEPGEFFLGLLLPGEDSMGEPDSISLSPDLKTVRFHNIQLQENTKYLIGVTAARSQTGKPLESPWLINFSTGSALPTGQITGNVSFAEGELSNCLAVAFDNLFADEGPVGAAVVDKNSGDFSIPYLDSGSYLIFAIKDSSRNGSYNPFGEMEPFGAYDQNLDQIPDSVHLSDGQIFSGVDILMQLSQLKTARDYLVDADQFALAWQPDAALSLLMTENLQVDGTSNFWFFLYGSAAARRSYLFFLLNGYLFSLGDDEIPDYEDFPPLPDEWIDSDLAADSALVNGGQSFLNDYPEANIQAWLQMYHEGEPKTLLNRSFNFSFQKKKLFRPHSLKRSVSDSLAVWAIVFYDEGSGSHLTLLLDAVSGSLIQSWIEGEPTSARENLATANQAAFSW
ncbi:MAG: Ig-like domain-containing protein, partial [bacterium]|nr:Ig-like domain-containing protein [bacterium]